ncbi:CHAT domain-containing protein [Bradyrhizobium yuanmingense]|uniref:CHAT domain-containing protein n=1 Tax=Bradyrhizobium yuanmingense TaxID=108015 RepID=UPI0012F75628|nr:CHAT domain-containing protein [Bradyrhizobium yuanmingense]MDF0522237.1 CHAT domain-containing protein [Bradyrhizobium yuanmingense]MVT55426.1 CHAT domain-containing protein [Bradyrhizobium yuanmingense]
MRDTIVSIIGGGNNDMIVCLESQSNHPYALEFRSLDLDAAAMPPLDTETNVTAYGAAVHKALSDHPAIKAELTAMFGQQVPQRAALRFLMKAPDAERFRWEAIHGGAEPRFLAMSELCTVSRLAPARIGSTLKAFTRPLRMFAFLSAAGIKADREMKTICDQIVESKQNGLEIECTVFLAEQALLDEYRHKTAVGPLHNTGITIEQMPSTATQVANLLRDAPVQFVHFFCHGIDRLGIQGLSIATTSDHEANEANGNADSSSIFLSVTALSEALALNSSVWVTVFNSCSGAEVLHQLFSMALTVARKGCPYTVGMAEPIDTAAATTFTQAFYRELFRIVGSKLTPEPAAGPVIFDFAPAVIPARRIIHDHCCAMPGGFGRWLLPVLYEASHKPFLALQLPADVASRVLAVARTLRRMEEETPEEVRDQIAALLDNPPSVPPHFRPNRFGEFATP